MAAPGAVEEGRLVDDVRAGGHRLDRRGRRGAQLVAAVLDRAVRRDLDRRAAGRGEVGEVALLVLEAALADDVELGVVAHGPLHEPGLGGALERGQVLAGEVGDEVRGGIDRAAIDAVHLVGIRLHAATVAARRASLRGTVAGGREPVPRDVGRSSVRSADVPADGAGGGPRRRVDVEEAGAAVRAAVGRPGRRARRGAAAAHAAHRRGSPGKGRGGGTGQHGAWTRFWRAGNGGVGHRLRDRCGFAPRPYPAGAGLMVIRRFAGSVRSSALDRDHREGSGTHLPYAVHAASVNRRTGRQGDDLRVFTIAWLN